MATRGVGPEARRPPVKARVNTSPGFSLAFLRSSAFSAEAPSSPGPHHSLPKGPEREADPQHKGDGHCHSPQSPAILKATFQFRIPPPPLPHYHRLLLLPLHRIILPRPLQEDRDGSERAAVGHLQWGEEPPVVQWSLEKWVYTLNSQPSPPPTPFFKQPIQRRINALFYKQRHLRRLYSVWPKNEPVVICTVSDTLVSAA